MFTTLLVGLWACAVVTWFVAAYRYVQWRRHRVTSQGHTLLHGWLAMMGLFVGLIALGMGVGVFGHGSRLSPLTDTHIVTALKEKRIPFATKAKRRGATRAFVCAE